MPKRTPPLINTPNQSISAVIGEGSGEFNKQIKYLEEIAGRIIKGSAENAFVLTIVLRELPKLKKGEQVGFDFGTKKEWQLKRVK